MELEFVVKFLVYYTYTLLACTYLKKWNNTCDSMKLQTLYEWVCKLLNFPFIFKEFILSFKKSQRTWPSSIHILHYSHCQHLHAALVNDDWKSKTLSLVSTRNVNWVPLINYLWILMIMLSFFMGFYLRCGKIRWWQKGKDGEFFFI